MLGFVILSHRHPEQLLRLVITLNRLYADPPIACHHDFSQSSLDLNAFPSNVAFVQPSVRTGWGKWSVVEGALRALALLYRDRGPDWFTLLSSADYPIRPAGEVLGELESAGVDAFLDFRAVGTAPVSPPDNPKLAHFETPGVRRLGIRRYLAAQLWLPALKRTPSGGMRLGRYSIHLPFRSPNAPFDQRFKCFVGDHWFSANRKVATLLLNPTAKHLKLQRYLRRRASADECYYQTVLANEPGLVIARDNKRFAEWNGGGAHPKDLTVEDLDAIVASSAHFARKFAPDAPVLDRLDERLGISASAWMSSGSGLPA